MNIIELKEFLEQFQVKELKINEFLQNKKIIEINNNFFLIKNDDKLNKNQVFQDTLIYIQLKDMLPSKYLLEFINKNSNSKVELKGEKQAINFTYGKNLSLESINNSIRFEKGKLYLATYNSKVIGYFEYNKKDKKHPITNLMSIGDYLKEN